MSQVSPLNSRPQLSLVIPAHNEEQNIQGCLDELVSALITGAGLDVELIVVADGCTDQTEELVQERMKAVPGIRLIRHSAPCGFGRAIRCGLNYAEGDVVVIYMADLSDRPQDVLNYYRLIIDEEYDCVFGSRFIDGGSVHNYPRFKLIVNRFVNTAIRVMFWTRFNDLTNAFKAYRREVIQSCGPYRSCHFNITLEMSLSALIAGYRIKQCPIHWEGRTWGSTKLKLREMGRRYLCTLMMLFFQRMLIADDVRQERDRTGASGEEILLTEVSDSSTV
ncbi:glycosyltransferase family 2 protein [Thalassoglobus sp. JC818]|uniref:glycosyltransferase family 2 protein n=1 Tax=Thalassoglobus sp. JC818 TaxID=3232136 RepID=UPI00345A1834